MVFVPMNETPVNVRETGPRRWKLCSAERSRITNAYLPRFRVATRPDPFLSEIVKLGPTAPVSVTAFERDGAAAVHAASASAQTATAISPVMRFIDFLSSGAKAGYPTITAAACRLTEPERSL